MLRIQRLWKPAPPHPFSNGFVHVDDHFPHVAATYSPEAPRQLFFASRNSRRIPAGVVGCGRRNPKTLLRCPAWAWGGEPGCRQPAAAAVARERRNAHSWWLRSNSSPHCREKDSREKTAGRHSALPLSYWPIGMDQAGVEPATSRLWVEVTPDSLLRKRNQRRTPPGASCRAKATRLESNQCEVAPGSLPLKNDVAGLR